MQLDGLWKVESNPQYNEVVVRIATSTWSSKSGINIQKRISYQKRKSIGFNFFEEEVSQVGSEVVEKITNLYEVPDGLYTIDICNERRDWQSGHIEDYDYVLVKYNDA